MMCPTNEFTDAPQDQTEFESGIMAAIQKLRADGSQHINHRDICYYNRWKFNLSTSRRIGILLNQRYSLIRVNNRNTYVIPEVA